jgi:hypothetical protein
MILSRGATSTFAKNVDGQGIQAFAEVRRAARREQGELVMGVATAHRQVTASNGVEVDEGIAELLEALWSRGMATEFSCQGDHGKLAHICFAGAADARHFMDAPGEFLLTVGESSRAWVDFPAHLIGGLIRYWSF